MIIYLTYLFSYFTSDRPDGMRRFLNMVVILPPRVRDTARVVGAPAFDNNVYYIVGVLYVYTLRFQCLYRLFRTHFLYLFFSLSFFFFTLLCSVLSTSSSSSSGGITKITIPVVALYISVSRHEDRFSIGNEYANYPVLLGERE